MSLNTQRSFTQGELGPELQGRIDLRKYYSSLKRIQNCTVQKQGGVRRRPGTKLENGKVPPFSKSFVDTSFGRVYVSSVENTSLFHFEVEVHGFKSVEEIAVSPEMLSNNGRTIQSQLPGADQMEFVRLFPHIVTPRGVIAGRLLVVDSTPDDTTDNALHVEFSFTDTQDNTFSVGDVVQVFYGLSYAESFLLSDFTETPRGTLLLSKGGLAVVLSQDQNIYYRADDARIFFNRVAAETVNLGLAPAPEASLRDIHDGTGTLSAKTTYYMIEKINEFQESVGYVPSKIARLRFSTYENDDNAILLDKPFPLNRRLYVLPLLLARGVVASIIISRISNQSGSTVNISSSDYVVKYPNDFGATWGNEIFRNTPLYLIDTTWSVTSRLSDSAAESVFTFRNEGDISFNLYKSFTSSRFGFLDNVVSSTYRDLRAIGPDYTVPPPMIENPLEKEGLKFRFCQVYQQRLYLTGIQGWPRRVLASQTGRFFEFGAEGQSLPNSPLDFNISGDISDEITFITELDGLFIGTEETEHRIDGVVTPASINASVNSGNGSSPLRPIREDRSIIFLHRDGRSIINFSYEDDAGGNSGMELTTYSPSRFFEHSPVAWVFQKGILPVLWVVDESGKLSGLTISLKEDVLAWHSHDVGGEVVDIRRAYGGREILLLIKRDGQLTLESLTDRNPFLDSSVTREAEAPFSVVTGLEHLEGRMVGVLGDGYVDACAYDNNALEVSGGQITLPAPRSHVVVGIECDVETETLDVASKKLEDSLTGERINVNSAVISRLNTPGFQIGAAGSTLRDITERSTIENMDVPLVGKTGPIKLRLEGDYKLGANVVLAQKRPLEFYILGIELLGDFISTKRERRIS